jgi:hypothetical protein
MQLAVSVPPTRNSRQNASCKPKASSPEKVASGRRACSLPLQESSGFLRNATLKRHATHRLPPAPVGARKLIRDFGILGFGLSCGGFVAQEYRSAQLVAVPTASAEEVRSFERLVDA